MLLHGSICDIYMVSSNPRLGKLGIDLMPSEIFRALLFSQVHTLTAARSMYSVCYRFTYGKIFAFTDCLAE